MDTKKDIDSHLKEVEGKHGRRSQDKQQSLSTEHDTPAATLDVHLDKINYRVRPEDVASLVTLLKAVSGQAILLFFVCRSIIAKHLRRVFFKRPILV